MKTHLIGLLEEISDLATEDKIPDADTRKGIVHRVTQALALLGEPRNE